LFDDLVRDPPDFPRLLPFGGKRRGEHTGQRGQQEAAKVHAGAGEWRLKSRRSGRNIALASGLRPVSIDGRPQMKKLLAGFVAVLFATPLIASAADTKPPVWKNDAGLHETKDIIGTPPARIWARSISC